MILHIGIQLNIVRTREILMSIKSLKNVKVSNRKNFISFKKAYIYI